MFNIYTSALSLSITVKLLVNYPPNDGSSCDLGISKQLWILNQMLPNAKLRMTAYRSAALALHSCPVCGMPLQAQSFVASQVFASAGTWPLYIESAAATLL